MNQRGERHETTPDILLGAYIAIAPGDTQPFITKTDQKKAALPSRKPSSQIFLHDFQIVFPRSSVQPAP
jgi:hypothetical protein